MTISTWGDEGTWGDDRTWGGFPIWTPYLGFVTNPAHDTRIFVRDGSYRRVGQLDGATTISYITRHRAVGTASLTINPYNGDGTKNEAVAALSKPGAGIVIMRDGIVVFSGPVTYLKRSRDAQDTALVEVTCADDNIWLARRIIKPEPSTVEPPYSTHAYDTQTGVASTVMRHYVGANLGSSATPERQLIALVLDADPLLGVTVTFDGRYQQLLATLATLSRASNLGFRISQDETSNDLRFTITPTVDRRGQIVFADTLGNLTDWSHEHTAADANYLYVGGAGSGTARTIWEQPNSPSIVNDGRAEAFYDQRQTSDTDALHTAAQAQLEQTVAKTAITFDIVDTAGHSWPDDWGLGDVITVIADGVRLDEIVREIRVDLTADGETITPTVATAGNARGTWTWQHAVAEARKRLTTLEGA